MTAMIMLGRIQQAAMSLTMIFEASCMHPRVPGSCRLFGASCVHESQTPHILSLDDRCQARRPYGLQYMSLPVCINSSLTRCLYVLLACIPEVDHNQESRRCPACNGSESSC